MRGARQDSPEVAPIPQPEAPKRAQTLARRIESDILRERLPVGHRLGTEAELQQRYAVSRAVLREAIRMLERHQLGETRRGPAGGLFVCQSAREAVARVLSLYLEAAGVTRSELFEVRRLVEPATAYHAARRSRSAARALSGLSAAALHGTIAELARSPALELFVHTLLLAAGEPDRMGAALRTRERALARRIVAGQAAQARSAMQAHLHAREASGPRARRASRIPQDGKRAEILVRELSETIRSEGLVPGTRLGSEPELIRRHGVGRAVLREAVRMLEQHSLVRMRRGSGGGLFVARPDPASVVLSASVYLAQLDPGPRSQHEARLALEPAAAALAAERASPADLRQLQLALGRTLLAGDGDLPVAARSLHERIADLCGNRALALFARAVITAAWGDERFAPRPPGLPPGWQDELRSSQIRIATAILSRDAPAARAAMEEHLDITTAWWTAVRG